MRHKINKRRAALFALLVSLLYPTISFAQSVKTKSKRPPIIDVTFDSWVGWAIWITIAFVTIMAIVSIGMIIVSRVRDDGKPGFWIVTLILAAVSLGILNNLTGFLPKLAKLVPLG